MKVTQSIWHDEYRRRMYFSLGFFLFFWMLIFPVAILTVKFDFTKKSFRVASLVSSYISTITAIVLSNDCVSSRRDYKEIGDHSAVKSWILVPIVPLPINKMPRVYLWAGVVQYENVPDL